MQRTKTPRHKLLSEMLKQCKNGKHEDKQGKNISRAKATKQCKQRVLEELLCPL